MNGIRILAGQFPVVTIIVLAACQRANGQSGVGPSLVIQPWEGTPHFANTYDELLFFERSKTKGRRESTKIFYWDSFGRIKFPRAETDPSFSLAYKFFSLDNDSDNADIKGQWNDVAVVGAWKVGNLFEDWKLSLIGGLGTANDGHWSNSDAVYGTGTVDVSTQISDAGFLHFGIYYDGNRPLFPDVPTPYAAYRTSTERLELTVGLPDTLLAYKITEDLSLRARYEFPVELHLSTEFHLVGGVYLAGGYTRAVRPFYIDERDNRRMFYEADRVLAGIRWITDWFDIGIHVGYALDHRFREGFDMRSLSTVTDLEEGTFAALILQGPI